MRKICSDNRDHLWQSGFREALSNPLDVAFPLERLPTDVFGERVA